MEACKGSMFRARAIANLGHDARLQDLLKEVMSKHSAM